MSHELRTPLNAILGFAQLLETDVTADPDRESVGHILRAGRHLLELINEVLDIARIEANKLSISREVVCLGTALTQSIELVRPVAQQRNVSLCSDQNEWSGQYVWADRQRLTQVLLNLLSNAIKFNREDGTVTVSCENAGDRFRISVTDTGHGMSKDDIGQLFNPFERLKADCDGIEGSGLGLALSKRLIELMGGSIGVESTEGVGSRFWIELPLAHFAGELKPSPTL